MSSGPDPHWSQVIEETLGDEQLRICRRFRKNSDFVEDFEIVGMTNVDGAFLTVSRIFWSGRVVVERFTMESNHPVMEDGPDADDSNDGWQKARNLAWNAGFIEESRRYFLGE